MILLADEEISKIRYKYNKLYKGGVFEYTMRPNHCELVAKAQLKKVVEWLERDYAVSPSGGAYIYLNEKKWQSLLEEVRDGI